MATPDMTTYATNVLNDALSPLMGIIDIGATLIGLGMIYWGCVRLLRHAYIGHQMMMHRVSPMATLLAFVIGTMLVAYTPDLSALSNSLFPGQTGLSHMTNYCVSGGGFNPDGVQYCPMMGYVSDLSNVPAGDTATNWAWQVLAYAVMYIIGVIAFLRGMVQLVRVSEGGGHNVSLGQAATHILAGILLVNAHAVTSLLQNTWSGIV